MKAILMSIHPVWCEKIFNGTKTIEVRKSRPKLETPFEVLVYCSKGQELWGNGEQLWKGIDENEDLETVFTLEPNLSRLNGKVIGSFVCDRIMELPCETTQPHWLKEKTCLSDTEYMNYLGHKDGYGWHITEPRLFDEPKELDVFWVVRCTNKEGDCKTCCEKLACINNITRPPQSWCYVGVEK